MPQAATGSEAPLQQTAGAVLEESGKEAPTGPKSFDSLRGSERSAFDKSEEELAQEKEEEAAGKPDPEEPENPEAEETEEVESGQEGKDKPKPETPKPEEGKEKPEEGKPSDTQTEDGYVAEVNLVVDGKTVPVPVSDLVENVEVDLYTPKGTQTVKGIENLRVLAQKGLYSDERNALANKALEDAKGLRSNFQKEVVTTAQQLANKYLADWMEKNLTGQPQDPNNPLSQAAPQDPNALSTEANRFLLSQLNSLRLEQENFKKSLEQERVKAQQTVEMQNRVKAGSEIANTGIMPFREKFKNTDGSYDDEAFVLFADTAANRTVFRVQQINQERASLDPEYPGMSKEEVATITRQVAQEVYQLDQKRLTRLMDQKFNTMRKTAKAPALRGGGAAVPAEEKPQANKGPRTFESLRQRKPA